MLVLILSCSSCCCLFANCFLCTTFVGLLSGPSILGLHCHFHLFLLSFCISASALFLSFCWPQHRCVSSGKLRPGYHTKGWAPLSLTAQLCVWATNRRQQQETDRRMSPDSVNVNYSQPNLSELNVLFFLSCFYITYWHLLLAKWLKCHKTAALSGHQLTSWYVLTSGLLDNVTVLIGIAYGGKAIAGVINQPFYNYQV